MLIDSRHKNLGAHGLLASSPELSESCIIFDSAE